MLKKPIKPTTKKKTARKTVVLEDQKSKKSFTITYSQPFSAVVEADPQGGNRLAIQSPAYYKNQVNKFKVGEKVTLEIHSRKAKRSDSQNRYYWGVYLPLIAAETGERDLDKLHEYFRGKFLTTGIIEVLGEKVRMKKSTTELSTSEFTMYIMDIEALTGVMAPPTENYDLPPLR